MANELKDCTVAIVVADGFEESEMVEPRKALEDAGADTKIISPEKGKVKAWKHGVWSDEYAVDVALDNAHPDDFDALLLPGGVMNPDTLRLYPAAINFISHIVQAGKPVAAICHGPWTLIDAGVIKGKTVTSWPSIKVDLQNGGAHWVDQAAVVDGRLLTSRKPDDLPVFNKEMIKLFSAHC